MGPAEPVPKRDRPAAMRHLVAGAMNSPEIEQRAETFLRLFHAGSPKRARLWWVHADREPRAVALVLTSRGRVGFLYHSPADVPGVDDRALIRLLRDVGLDSLRRGATMVQSMIETPHDGDERVLSAAGMEPFAELISMQCELTDAEDSETRDWRFIDYRRFRRTTLIETIRRTYEQTLDCPRLTGVRCPKDILASHRSTGVYRPRWWWLALRDDAPAGCILVNAATVPATAQIVYMGVAKEHRGRGLGTAMLQHARRQTRREGVRRMRLSVDADNVYARNLYERFGFVETGRKRCFVLLPTTGKNGCE